MEVSESNPLNVLVIALLMSKQFQTNNFQARFSSNQFDAPCPLDSPPFWPEKAFGHFDQKSLSHTTGPLF